MSFSLRARGLRAATRSIGVKPLRSTLPQVRYVQIDADKSSPMHELPSSGSEPFKVQLHADSFHSYRCDAPPPETTVTKDELVSMYHTMVQMRRMEQAADALYKQKLIRGFCHLAIGQEAVSVGMETAIDDKDRVITSYRCHTFAVLRGGTIKGVLAELMGRKDGMSFGKGGSMHIFTPTFFGGNGIVGAQVPVGAGVALAQKYNKEKAATFALYGDGASNQGQVFEAFNMAKLWNLPCVFVCENNKYGMGTSAERSSMNTQFFTRGDKIPGLQVNGMDILAVREATKWAKDWVTSGKGPLLMEFVTYRYGGHSMSDPGTTYRTREEVQQMRSSQDAIAGLKKYILEWGVTDEASLKAIDKSAKEEVDAAVEEAKKSPFPDQVEFWSDIYYKGSEPTHMRGREKEEVHYYNKSA
ncbi:pyruvate dehydrogenase (acetyl-transferring) E1 component, alpha subunit [Cryptococcus deuterogattii 99/473]|uniref:Pyruvate dehydrogenase E1 component subunit alpha n=4 Tax=Cryptococcus gattii species complex TaxID=1884637 RepID=A0A0D0TR20_9TREE|nr:pyruvate dehydrogenase (acetyl-transferring) E1 component alpha subunit [Cryptococcus deuterogattii R265]KIR28426.1 pyruvate dehydrogenase (acetyl-transferring) E1 component, alpha subunit [Cryptococcus deuterogattii LA55]KIR34955.1 pyruvate dehydrogenase (acetyl-transferring) E1 component, alpha subunit [Cryptococcus deuterogattii MMRL2647]KIR37903.1 pyruvate dehydrogenase (acetyl-transferring) E1 component, alpha subunit [Cryptococcus deuterogattii Ram5]KIR70094.1 pyruvate dehydrogenase (a